MNYAILTILLSIINFENPNIKFRVDLSDYALSTDTFFNRKIKSIKMAFKENNYKMFYDLFPFTYDEFSKFYGFDEKIGKMPLYDDALEHINFLFQYDGKVTDKEFAEKLFEFAKNLEWEADGIGYFQTNLTNLIKRKPDVFVRIFNCKSEKGIYSFWYFIFDGSSRYDKQNKNNFNELYNLIKSIDNKQALLLKLEFENMYIK